MGLPWMGLKDRCGPPANLASAAVALTDVNCESPSPIIVKLQTSSVRSLGEAIEQPADDPSDLQNLGGRLVQVVSGRNDILAGFAREPQAGGFDQEAGGGQRLIELMRQGSGYLRYGAENLAAKHLALQLPHAGNSTPPLGSIAPPLICPLERCNPSSDPPRQSLIEPRQCPVELAHFRAAFVAIPDVPRGRYRADGAAR